MTEITAEMQKKLIQEAINAQANAYAPYSNFRVGAALLLADGTIEVGCNVENASYGLAICAERVAITTAVAKGKTQFVAMAVVAPCKGRPGAPCGACRQFIAEFNGDLPIIMSNPDGQVLVMSMRDLLPEQFTKSSLD